MQNKNDITMENEENKLTNDVDNYEITDTLSAFRLLDTLRQQKQISVHKVCEKINIKKSAYYRYCSEYSSQKASQPSVTILRRYADVFDYKVVFSKKY